MAMVAKLALVGALSALISVAATNSKTTQLQAKAAQPIMDEAALQEAEINDKEATREQEMGSYIDMGEEMGSYMDDEDSEPGNGDEVHELNAALDDAQDEDHEEKETADDDEEKTPKRRNLRAKAKASSDATAVLPPAKLAANVLDPSQWTGNQSSEAGAMEKQLTDLMMSGNAMAGTPFGKSVEQISKLIKDDMMVKVNSAHKANQEQLDKEAKAIEDCFDTKDSQVVSADKKKAEYLKTSPMHKTCRAGEAGKLTEKQESFNEMKDKQRIKELKCKEFAMVSRQHGDQQANGQIVKKGGSEENESYIRRLTSTICGKYPPAGKGGGGRHGFLDNFLIAKEECERATKEHRGQVKKYNTVSEEYDSMKSECDSLQDQMDHSSCKRATEMKDACETYAECYFSRTQAHTDTVHMVMSEEKDRKAEWKGLKRMQCLMKAFNDGQVSSGEIKKCKKMTHGTDHLIVKYPKVPKLDVCSVPNLYPSTPAYKLAEFVPLPALAKGKQDANECAGLVEISTEPMAGSPYHCRCERVTLNGPYSAGPLVKCTNCLDVRRSRERNSCPEGTKIFSPRSSSDWKTIFSSVGEVADPQFIVDVTRPMSGPVRKKKLMNSHKGSGQGRDWKTSDNSPWWLRSTMFTEPTGDGQPNCYLHVYKKGKDSWNENSISFNDNGCSYHSKSYFCQLKDVHMEPKKGSPPACKCAPVVLAGAYSAGALVKCSNCLDVYRSMQRNSCPEGTKIFSPRNARDWKTFLASAQPLRSPSWIVDVTRPQNGCGGCQHKPMNSKSPAQMTWRTADGSPWWLRSSTYTEPNGDYSANCYMDLWKTPFSETNIMFNDEKCKAHSDAYYCQPVRKRAIKIVRAPRQTRSLSSMGRRLKSKARKARRSRAKSRRGSIRRAFRKGKKKARGAFRKMKGRFRR